MKPIFFVFSEKYKYNDNDTYKHWLNPNGTTPSYKIFVFSFN